MQSKILIVEGYADKLLFEAILKKIKLDVCVTVATPLDIPCFEELKIDKNGKKDALKAVKLSLKQMLDKKSDVTHLALILDADYENSDGGGFVKTSDTVFKKIGQYKYTEPKREYTGLVFPHSDGLNPFGLWVMPNNQDDGMCEDWIKNIIKKEDNLLNHACNTVKALDNKRFNEDIHIRKAEIATYMAWQESPPQGNDYIIKNNLIDEQSQDYLNLTSWLKHIFI